MLEFPSTRELLGELVSLKSYTPQGQRDIAEYLCQFAKRWSLGDTQLWEYPEGAKGAEQEPRPCNVVMDIGQGKDETLLIHGHFDKVPPEGYSEKYDPRLDQLIAGIHDPDICHGVGSYDMLGGITGMLEAAHQMQVATHRRVRMLFVSNEEDQSQGTHAALHPKNDLVEGASCIVSTEIPVGATLSDRANLYIGRTGRVGLHLDVYGPRMHSGRVRRNNYRSLASQCFAHVLLALQDIHFPEHPNDPQHLMPESLCIPRRGASADTDVSLSIPDSWAMKLDVFYADTRLDPAAIRNIVWRAIRDRLGNEDFSLIFEKGRMLPFTKPWLEEAHHPFVLNGLKYAEEVYSGPVQRQAARGVADESILVHAKHIPAICFPPEGEDEHMRTERVRISSISEGIVPFLRKMVAHEGSLTRPSWWGS